MCPIIFLLFSERNRVDPTGMFDLDDDYFNQNGKYLGTDNSSTDNVKVVDQAQWEINSNGDGTIDPEIGSIMGALHSNSNISVDASLSIYKHYNSTGMPLRNTAPGSFDEGSTGMITQSINGDPIRVDVDVAGLNESGISNHSNEIKSLFTHERVHVSDMKVMGYKLTSGTPEKMGEARALQIQISDPAFSKTGSGFQAGINGYVKWLKLQPIALPGIQKPFK